MFTAGSRGSLKKIPTAETQRAQRAQRAQRQKIVNNISMSDEKPISPASI
jgi:hypothetical protein